jgi:hypothetical protein
VLVVWKAVQVSRMHVITSQRPLQDMSWIGLLEQPDCSVEFYSESDSPVLRSILVDQPGARTVFWRTFASAVAG